MLFQISQGLPLGLPEFFRVFSPPHRRRSATGLQGSHARAQAGDEILPGLAPCTPNAAGCSTLKGLHPGYLGTAQDGSCPLTKYNAPLKRWFDIGPENISSSYPIFLLGLDYLITLIGCRVYSLYTFRLSPLSSGLPCLLV